MSAGKNVQKHRVNGNTSRALRRILSETLPETIPESDDPVEITYVNYVMAGMGLVAAYCLAHGLRAPENVDEARQHSPNLARFTTSLPLRALLRRRLIERAESEAERGAVLRNRIEQALVDIMDDDMLSPQARMAAIDRIAKLGHVQAYVQQEAADTSDESTPLSEVYKDLLRMAGKAASKKPTVIDVTPVDLSQDEV